MNARYKNKDQNISFVRIASESDSEAPIILHVEREDLELIDEKKETQRKRNSCDAILDQSENTKKTERKNVTTL